jgi:predicted small secreted protein
MAKRFSVKLLIAALLLGGLAVSLPACNTIEGIGEDISALGRGVSRGARSVQN